MEGEIGRFSFGLVLIGEGCRWWSVATCLSWGLVRGMFGDFDADFGDWTDFFIGEGEGWFEVRDTV
ncbi:MAG TPA: hypothetical protein VLL52_19650 [Anaerolineae bacterium]|nr:hypothetical protein [Anaerolineae bacterium]